jgi:uncharacterized repeat protein (TIGR01451 family)
MVRRRLALLIPGLMILTLVVAPAAFAQEGTPPAQEQGLQLTTEFPSLVIGVDETVTLNLTLRTGTTAQVVDLTVEDLPADWVATFRGGGRTVRSVYVQPGEDASVDLRLEPPANVAAGDYRLQVLASGEGDEARLPIDLSVQEKAPASLAFDIELPTLRGKPSTTFRYNVTLRNDGDEDLTVDLFAQAPPAFRVTFTSGGQEVTSIPVAANSSQRLSVAAEPLLNNVAADAYPITLRAQGGDVSATAELVAEVVGQADLSLSTPDGRLSGRAEAGRETTFTLSLQNNGSAPAEGISMSATPPSGWNVEFDPPQIEAIEPGGQRDVTARVTPADQALAGDYVISFRAQPEGETSQSIDFRVTVRTSTLWGVAGIALVALSIGVVGWAVMRFGRR